MRLSRLWTVLAIALPVLGALLPRLSTVDLMYHLRAGAQLLDTGRIAVVDSFSFTAAGQPWLNQQWGAQALFAVVERLAGIEGLFVLRALVVGLIFGLVLRACLVRGASPRTAALLSLAAFLVTVAALALRPQLLGMALFAATLLLVAERRRRARALWLVVPVALVWANVHGSFVLAPAVVGIAWLEDRAAGDPAARRTLSVALVAFAATLVNPFGLGVWTYALGLTTNGEVTRLVSEWQPTSLRSPAGLAFFTSALAVAALLARRRAIAPWPSLLWLGFLFVLGAYAERGIAWWGLGAPVAVAGLTAASAAVGGGAADRPRAANGAIVVALVAAAVALLPWWRGDLLAHAPTQLTAELRATATGDDRIFNPQRLGSWVEWAVPQAPVFVDSRIELFDAAIWSDHVAVRDGHEGWREILDRWRVTIVLADDDQMAGLGDRLATDPGWSRTYADDDGSIFVRADR